MSDIIIFALQLEQFFFLHVRYSLCLYIFTILKRILNLCSLDFSSEYWPNNFCNINKKSSNETDTYEEIQRILHRNLERTKVKWKKSMSEYWLDDRKNIWANKLSNKKVKNRIITAIIWSFLSTLKRNVNLKRNVKSKKCKLKKKLNMIILFYKT